MSDYTLDELKNAFGTMMKFTHHYVHNTVWFYEYAGHLVHIKCDHTGPIVVSDKCTGGDCYYVHRADGDDPIRMTPQEFDKMMTQYPLDIAADRESFEQNNFDELIGAETETDLVNLAKFFAIPPLLNECMSLWSDTESRLPYVGYFSMRVPCDDMPGTFTITFPDLPGCITQGNGEEDADAMSEDVLLIWLTEHMKENDSLPYSSMFHEAKRLARAQAEGWGETVPDNATFVPIYVKRSLIQPN